MSLYPSLEDMEADKMIKAQIQECRKAVAAPSYGVHPPQSIGIQYENSVLYPSLNDFMGMEITTEMLAANQVALFPSQNNTMVTVSSHAVASAPSFGMVAPLSGQSMGLARAQVTHGIRELVLCKGSDGKIGVRCQAISKGIFVSLVQSGSPAALAGLRFGDQILQINGENVAGYSMDKVHNIFKKAGVNSIRVAVRDRPFERSITLHKDSFSHVGFTFKEGCITSLVKESSAARNGLLTDHNLLEINGQNVVGLKDKEISRIMDGAGTCVTLTVMPKFLYEHMIKNMSSSLLKKSMDHSLPDL
ncbi:hypothetical protein OUZ56_006399 [Daphnia magna]|uniref:PDZ domain-containing protein n=1 Tax=Daphnia magna TaxID=35525 RepID=A0ABQ9YVK0_9CRUS|nr:hypothetical protein OUZ56_006399 [Daphnia magna]